MALNLTPEQTKLFDRAVSVVTQFVRKKTKISSTPHPLLPATLLCASLILGAQKTFAQTKTTDTTSQTILSDKALFSLALQAQKTGNTVKAIELYTQALAVNPNYADAYINRGLAQVTAVNYDAAISDYTQAITLDPKKPLSYVARGNAYFDLEKYQKAIDDYTQVIILDPNNPLLYKIRGSAYVRLKDYEKAINDYTQSITLDPKNAAAYVLRSSTYVFWDNLPAAQIDARRACDLGSCETLELLNKLISGE